MGVMYICIELHSFTLCIHTSVSFPLSWRRSDLYIHSCQVSFSLVGVYIIRPTLFPRSSVSTFNRSSFPRIISSSTLTLFLVCGVDS